MPAYVISEVHVPENPEVLAAYKPLAKASVVAFGGTYLVRDALPEILEGAPFESDERLVIIEFPDVETARDWYASPAYAEALEAAGARLKRRLFIVPGPSADGPTP